MVGETYKLLIRVARDQESLDSSSILEPIKHLSERLEGYSSAFAYINALEDRLGHFSKPTADPEAAKLELVTLSASHAWLISERKAWEKTASELEQSITALQGQMQEVLAGSAWLTLQRDAWAQVAVCLLYTSRCV